MSTLRQLYRETILRHAANPVGFRRPIEATHRCEGHNPQCGDRVEVVLRLEDQRIGDIGFEGEACSICIASASLMCEQARGMPLARFRALSEGLAAALADSEGPEDIGALSALLGVRPYPSRIQCATLPWTTAERALKNS